MLDGRTQGGDLQQGTPGEVMTHNVVPGSILAVNTRYAATWLRPTQILAPRLVKLSAQLTF